MDNFNAWMMSAFALMATTIITKELPLLILVGTAVIEAAMNIPAKEK